MAQGILWRSAINSDNEKFFTIHSKKLFFPTRGDWVVAVIVREDYLVPYHTQQETRKNVTVIT